MTATIIREFKEFREFKVLVAHDSKPLNALSSLNSLKKVGSLSNIATFVQRHKTMNGETLIKSQGDYHNLICYRKAELIYDITHHFAYSAFNRGDRTIDQMVQAARSGKQNIIEGSADIETSIELGIKLINIAKASFKELLADYEDYLRVNSFEQWSNSSDKHIAMRKLGIEDSNQHILDIAKSRPLETVANMAIILLKQEDYLLHKLLTSLSDKFLTEGGFKKRMHRMRVECRGR